MERPLFDFEAKIIERLAEILDPNQKEQLLFDLNNSTVIENSEGLPYITFKILGYERSASKGKHGYSTEGAVVDSDGVEVQVWLFADENNRLYELEFARVDAKDIINPNWDSLKVW